MVKIIVPATSANLGAGFDCMGLAIDLFNEIWIEPWDRLLIETDDDLPKDGHNLVASTFKKTYELLGKKFVGAKIHQINNIPKTSGLGSSAACIVGGAAAANAMLNNPLSREELINFCTGIDGHPDNVVPAIIGGITASVINGAGKVHSFKCDAKNNLKLAVMIADFQLSTTKARAILPTDYSRNDLVYSMSRAVTTFAALMQGEYSKLKYLIDDKIHTPYRKPLIKNFAQNMNSLMENGALGVFLSGAGPTIAAFVDDNFTPFTPPKNWRLEIHNIVSEGLKIN